MTPVFQTKFGLEGNCFAACVATILGCAIEDVPATLDADQNRDLNRWLSARELHYFECEVSAVMSGTFEEVHCIFTVESDTPEVRAKGFTHAVVGKYDEFGRAILLHDPKPGSDQTREIKPTITGVFLNREIALQT